MSSEIKSIVEKLDDIRERLHRLIAEARRIEDALGDLATEVAGDDEDEENEEEA